MKNGKVWVIAVLALGSVGGIIAVTHWRRPENSVRWSFTQIHTLLVRAKKDPKLKDAPLKYLAPTVSLEGRELPAAEFLVAYGIPAQAGEIDVRTCPSQADHWTVVMTATVYCFIVDGNLWKLHAVTSGPCRCR